MDPLYKSVKIENLSSAAVKQILNLIINQTLKPGDKLPSETELSRLMGMSRGTLREALKSLENLGVISSKPGAGRYVNFYGIEEFLNNLSLILSIDVKEISDLLEFRKMLELFLIEKAVKNFTKEDLSIMKKEIILAEKHINDNRKFIDHDLNFHMLIYKASGNSVIPKLIEIIRSLCLRQQYEIGKNQGALKRALEFHKEIYKAIVNKDVDLAKQEMIAHFDDVKKALMKDMKEE
ncbi:MAG: FadR/GntR family transcriptional regulator [Actinomycetota bacterium]|nr:FadR/GntR family transcriptional regulator [Actinomycetota bacterium]